MNEAYREYLAAGQQAGIRYGIAVPNAVQFGPVGSELGSHQGSSLEFMEHREYIPGDDLRLIDWSAFARSDKLSVKLYRDEVSPHIDIIIDLSRSMALEDTAKAQATLGLAALFAQAAANCNYTFRAWGLREQCREVINGTDQPALWDGIEFDYCGNCGQALRQTPPLWKPRGIRVFISDLLWMGLPEESLSVLSERASAVFVVQLLARADAEPPQRGNVRVRDCETGQSRDVFIDATTQQRYHRTLASHQYNWNRSCRQFGAIMQTLIAEDIPADWSMDKLVLSQMLKVL